jgi:hypothetical protein
MVLLPTSTLETEGKHCIKNNIDNKLLLFYIIFVAAAHSTKNLCIKCNIVASSKYSTERMDLSIGQFRLATLAMSACSLSSPRRVLPLSFLSLTRLLPSQFSFLNCLSSCQLQYILSSTYSLSDTDPYPLTLLKLHTYPKLMKIFVHHMY